MMKEGLNRIGFSANVLQIISLKDTFFCIKYILEQKRHSSAIIHTFCKHLVGPWMLGFISLN